MPVTKDSKSGKWRIGSGKPMYSTKEAAERAYKAYLAKKYSKAVEEYEDKVKKDTK